MKRKSYAELDGFYFDKLRDVQQAAWELADACGELYDAEHDDDVSYPLGELESTTQRITKALEIVARYHE